MKLEDMIGAEIDRGMQQWQPIGWSPETADTYVPHEWENVQLHRCPKCNTLFIAEQVKGDTSL